jgi:putative SOS response-associated peptidase YedK
LQAVVDDGIQPLDDVCRARSGLPTTPWPPGHGELRGSMRSSIISVWRLADGHFANSTRCIVSASAFFEFTGKRYPKAEHRFALRGSPVTAIAAISRPAQGNQPRSFAMLTTSPGSDVAPYHNRQVVVLHPQDGAAWIHLTKTESELLRPLPEGSLEVTTISEGA